MANKSNAVLVKEFFGASLQEVKALSKEERDELAEGIKAQAS